MSYSTKRDSFIDSLPQGVTGVVRNNLGQATYWTENGFAMTMTRDASGNPLSLRAVSSRLTLVQFYQYDASNRLISVSGDRIDSVIIPEIIGLVGGKSSSVLKSFTGSITLTGGTVNTKTTMMQVPLADGCLLDYGAELRLNAIFGFTMNTNTKSFGIDIGQTADTAVNIWTRSRSSATSGIDAPVIELQRHPTTPTQLIGALGIGAVSTEGSTNINSTLLTGAINLDPSTTGLSLFFWGQLVTANTDVITLARARVALNTAAS